MIGKRRILTGLMIALCFASQANAETIPFDYFFGRIIGRTQIQSIHDAYNDEHGSLTTSLKTGYGDAVSVNVGSLFEIGPTSQSNVFQVEFLRPKLSAAARLGPRMRLLIHRLDWQEDSEFRLDETMVSLTQHSDFLSDQTLRMLHKDIEFDPSRSLYYYTKGMVLQPRNWSLDASLQLNISDYSRRMQWPKILPSNPASVLVKTEEVNDSRYWVAGAVSSYGVSRKLQLTLGWELGRQNRPASQIRDSYDLSDLDSHVVRSVGDRDDAFRSNEIFVEALLLKSNRHWASIRPSFHSYVNDNKSENTNWDDSQIRSRTINKLIDDTNVYGISADHTWISNDATVPLGQILDDHTSYYGHRLTPGTFRISSSADLTFGREKYERTSERVDTSIRDSTTYRSRRDRLSVTSEVSYFSKFNLDLLLRFILDRKVSGSARDNEVTSYGHTQRHYFDLQLSYYSFRWDSDKRQSIGWNQINDIDYLLGPLMQPRDWRASISVTPPAHEWSGYYDEENIFNFFKGESNNRWILSYSSALGVCDGVEIGLDATYQQDVITSAYDPDYLSRYRYDRWTVRPHFRWQPGTRFRMDFTAEEYYSDYDGVTWHGYYETREHEYRHTWAIKVVYSILI